MSTRGVITFVFDDGYEQVYQNVVPLLRQYNIPAVFALALDAERLENTEQRKIRPYPRWLHLRTEGHELAAHSVTHTNLTKVPHKQREDELKRPAEALNASTFVYPGGAYNDEVIELAKKYFTSARTIQPGFESLRPQKPYALKSYNFSRRNFSVYKVNALALWAYSTNSWFIETYHMIDDDEHEKMHTVRTEDLARHLRFVSRLPIAVKTIRDVINSN